jgi:hypothetical protein
MLKSAVLGRVAAAAIALVAPRLTLAWGAVGHQVVAELAARELEPAARDAVRALLGSSMASVSTWADDIRRKRPQTARWHYTNVPLDTAGFDAERDCPGAQCVVGALERQLELLRDPQRPRAARAEALRWVIHLVADLHQPLHCADRGDKGGNALEVRWFRRRSNLHKVWDSDILAEPHRSTRQLVAALRERTSSEARASAPLKLAELREQLVRWVNEGQMLARDVAYAVPASGQLDAAYYERAAPFVDRQLIRAGARLAQLLNAALGARQARSAAGPGPAAREPTPPMGPMRSACTPAGQCCKVCSASQACGDSCISASAVCHRDSGCACDVAALCR